MKNKYKRIVGVDDAEGPPVPIPNTEVKLSGAENTWLVTARKNREMPTQAIHPNGCFALYSSIAQSVERMTVNHDVTGSSPVGGATKVLRAIYGPFCYYCFETVGRKGLL